jgi:hypothetical protein
MFRTAVKEGKKFTVAEGQVSCCLYRIYITSVDKPTTSQKFEGVSMEEVYDKFRSAGYSFDS